MKRILVIAESTDIDNSSGAKANMALIKKPYQGRLSG